VVISLPAPATVCLPATEITTAVLEAEPAFARTLLDFSLSIRPPPVAIAIS
jgi:hypothetical protein